VNYASPVDVARAFTLAYYSYNWKHPATLDPVVRVEPYATGGYLGTLQPLAQVFPQRMTAAQEVSAATIRSAAVPPDAPGTAGGSAFVEIQYAQHLTDHGQSAEDESAWSLDMVKVGGVWLVAAVVDQD